MAVAVAVAAAVVVMIIVVAVLVVLVVVLVLVVAVELVVIVPFCYLFTCPLTLFMPPFLCVNFYFRGNGLVFLALFF